MSPWIKPARGSAIPNIGFILILLGLLAAFAKQGYWLKSGADMFLDDSHLIAPIYPLFLRIHQWIFGDGALTVAAFTQLLLGFGTCYWFAHALSKNLSLPDYLKFLLTFILLLPYFPATRFGNAIANEGLAYPLFLVVAKYILDGVHHQKTSSLIKAFLWSVPLILVRKQFLLFFPCFALVLAYIYFFASNVYRKHTLLVIFIITVIAVNMIERGWQYKRDDHFSSIPFSGFVLIAMPLYVSSSGDNKYLRTEDQRAIFEKTHARMMEKGLHKNSRGETKGLFIQPVAHFSAAYNSIIWQTLLPAIREQGVSDWYRIDSMTTDMAWTLARHNAREYLQIYRHNFIAGAGGKSHAVFLFLFLLLAAVYHAKYRDGLSLAAVVVSVLSVGNLMLVAMAEPVLPRYLAYTQNLQICFYVIVAYEGYQHARRQLNN
jgi:O-antigen ligase